MINFRFHVVSIVAAFLALAVGVVFGSTIVDQAIVDGLRSDLRNTRKGVTEARDQNEQLKSDIERFDNYSDAMAPFIVEDRLSDSSVVLVVERGVDEGLVESQRDLLAAAGASVVVVVWLEPKVVTPTDYLERLQEIVHATSPELVDVRAATFDALAFHMRRGVLTADEQTAPAEEQVDLPVLALADEGFIAIDGDVEALQGSPAELRRAIIVGSLDATAEAMEMLAEVASAFDSEGFEAALGEVSPNATDIVDLPDRGARLLAVTSGPLATRVATVDNVDELQGRVALVLALADVVDGVVGHYGFGVGATHSSPTWSQG